MEPKPLPDFRAVRVAAGEVLSQKSNRLKLIEGLVFCAAPVLLTVVLAELFENIAALTIAQGTTRMVAAIGFNCILALLHLFLTLPLLFGLLEMAERMTEGEYVSLVDLFEPFSVGKRYRRALGVAFRWFWTVGILILVEVLTAVFFRATMNGRIWLVFLEAVLAVAEVIFWFFFVMRRFVTLSFVISRRMPLSDARRATGKMARYSRKGGLIWLLCWIPWILLGFLTVGILLLADVLPRMCVSYFLYCDESTKNANSSEVSNHE